MPTRLPSTRLLHRAIAGALSGAALLAAGPATAGGVLFLAANFNWKF